MPSLHTRLQPSRLRPSGGRLLLRKVAARLLYVVQFARERIPGDGRLLGIRSEHRCVQPLHAPEGAWAGGPLSLEGIGLSRLRPTAPAGVGELSDLFWLRLSASRSGPPRRTSQM